MSESATLSRAKVIRHYAAKPPKTESDLARLTLAVEGRPWLITRVCRPHSTPWDLVRDGYFAVTDHILGLGPRGGYKTKSVGLLHTLELLTMPEIQIAHAGGTKKQATVAHKWCKGFLTSPAVLESGLVDPDKLFKDEMSLPNGASMNLLTASRSGVQSQHVQRLTLDEIDDERVSQDLIDDAISVTSSFGGYRRCTVYTSARRFDGWNVDIMMESPKYRDVLKHVWCWLEATEGCPVERRGEERDIFDVDDILDPEGEPVTITAFKGCKTCRLVPDCRSMAARAGGWDSLRDVIVDFGKMDHETWLRQKRSVRVRERRGKRVFLIFSKERNVREVVPDPTEPIRLVVDFGGGGKSSTAVLFYQEIDGRVAVFAEYVQTKTDPDEDVPATEAVLADLFPGMEIAVGVGDSAQPIILRQWNKLTEKFILEPVKKLPTKRQMVRRLSSMLQPVGGEPRFVMHPRCEVLIKQLSAFKIKSSAPTGSARQNIYEDGDDDTVDAATYIAIGVEDSGAEPNVWVIDVESGGVVGGEPSADDRKEVPFDEVYREEMQAKLGRLLSRGDD